MKLHIKSKSLWVEGKHLVKCEYGELLDYEKTSDLGGIAGWIVDISVHTVLCYIKAVQPFVPQIIQSMPDGGTTQDVQVFEQVGLFFVF